MYVWGIYLKSTCPFICLFIYKKEKNNKFYQGIDISIITGIFILVNKNIFKNKCIKILKISNNLHIKIILITIDKFKYVFMWSKNFFKN